MLESPMLYAGCSILCPQCCVLKVYIEGRDAVRQSCMYLLVRRIYKGANGTVTGTPRGASHHLPSLGRADQAQTQSLWCLGQAALRCSIRLTLPVTCSQTPPKCLSHLFLPLSLFLCFSPPPFLPISVFHSPPFHEMLAAALSGLSGRHSLSVLTPVGGGWAPPLLVM